MPTGCTSRWICTQVNPFPGLEGEASATVDDSTVERRPSVYGPSSIWLATRQEQRIPSRLSHVRQVFQIQKKLHVWCDFVFRHRTHDYVGRGRVAIWVVFQTLPASVIAFQAHPR